MLAPPAAAAEKPLEPSWRASPLLAVAVEAAALHREAFSSCCAQPWAFSVATAWKLLAAPVSQKSVALPVQRVLAVHLVLVLPVPQQLATVETLVLLVARQLVAVDQHVLTVHVASVFRMARQSAAVDPLALLVAQRLVAAEQHVLVALVASQPVAVAADALVLLGAPRPAVVDLHVLAVPEQLEQLVVVWQSVLTLRVAHQRMVLLSAPWLVAVDRRVHGPGGPQSSAAVGSSSGCGSWSAVAGSLEGCGSGSAACGPSVRSVCLRSSTQPGRSPG